MNKPTEIRLWAVVLMGWIMGLLMVMPASAQETPYQTGFMRWDALDGGLNTWQRQGVVEAEGKLRLDPTTAQTEQDPYAPGSYNGHNFYNGGSFWVGEAISPAAPAPFPFQGALVSWNADTPSGTWLETQIRVQISGRWTKWYNVGVWASDSSTIERHSVDQQKDSDGDLSVDTFILNEQQPGATTFQVKLRLFSLKPELSPTLRQVAVALSTIPEKPTELAPGDPKFWNQLLPLPECSQMVYKDGGEGWCSPTSVSMVRAYWQKDTGACEPRVRSVVDGVYDWLYDGHGNWLFNAAYAATLLSSDGTKPLEGVVTRFTRMAQLEPWIGAGVPVVISFAWAENELTGAAIPKSKGHLAVLVGFDLAGNPIVNDPAAASDVEVQRTYPRSQLETLWLQHSGGTVYLIYPIGWEIPKL